LREKKAKRHGLLLVEFAKVWQNGITRDCRQVHLCIHGLGKSTHAEHYFLHKSLLTQSLVTVFPSVKRYASPSAGILLELAAFVSGLALL
jgi:hypothetical protein